jgi:GT2 family glycosyltransferase
MSEPGAREISVVIASIVGGRFLDDCLASLEADARRRGDEVIVVASGSQAEARRIESAHDWVTVLHRTARETVPQLRKIGVEAASGRTIAIIEEHCVAGPDWLDTIARTMHGSQEIVAGGAIWPDGYQRTTDWVVYFCEYNISLPPAERGEVSFLNGANIAYHRETLERHAAILGDGYWEAVLHPRLLSEGVKLMSIPEMVVRHRGPFPLPYYLRQRYWFSRAFAGARHVSAPARAAYLVAAPLLPAVLAARMGSRVAAKKMHTAQFLKALPLIVPALVVYVAGEWMGYLAGPGDALSKVE